VTLKTGMIGAKKNSSLARGSLVLHKLYAMGKISQAYAMGKINLF